MLSAILFDLARTPWWILLLLVNLTAGLLASFTQVLTLDHRRTVVRWSGYAFGVLVCAIVGVLVLLAYGVTVWIERASFRHLSAIETRGVR